MRGIQRILSLNTSFPMNSDLYQLVYVSAATDLFEEDELHDILTVSRRNNQKRGITGMLLYHDGGFIQALEGPQDEVLDLYRKIERDPRHNHAIKLLNGPIEARNFPEWKMGFQKVDGATADLPGFSHFLEEPSPSTAGRKELAHPIKLLLSFKETNVG